MTTRTLKDLEKSPNQAFLTWNDGHHKQTIELGEFLNLGRDPSNQLVLDDLYSSGRHARFERRTNCFVVRDLRSKNGTYLNGSRVLEAVLDNNDLILIGKTAFRFSWERDNRQYNLATGSQNLNWNTQLQRLPNIANSNLPVLLTGPSGTGKEILAQLIHQQSSRSAGPFVSVNCSALSESLVESELFGHVKGSFTGATNDRRGAFESARNGTLFLDEIGDLPLALQPKLLRALENHQIQPVGSDRTITTNVRIIAATHHNLKRKVLEEHFRADLYFRLNVIQITTPALVDRMEDFESLLYFFSREHRVRFSQAAIERLKEHSWPGNIRELKNTVARASAFFQNNAVEASDVELILDKIKFEQASVQPAIGRNVIREIEYEMIKSRLIANQGNQRKTATDLGIPKSTLHDRIRQYNINIDDLVTSA